MKRITAIIITLAVYPVISSAAESAVGRVYVMSGNVAIAQGGKKAEQVKKAKKARQAKQVNVSEPIVAGSLIETGEGSAALLKFEDGQMVTVQSTSAFQVNEYRYDPERIENSKVDFTLLKGGVRFVPGLIGRTKRLAFSLLTRNATIRGGAAEFAVVKADDVIHSRVLAGEIRITNSAGTASFKAGQSPTVPSSLMLASAFYPTGSRDFFDEVLAIPVIPPAIIGPAPAAAVAAAPEPATGAIPEPEAAPAPAPDLVPATASEPATASAPLPAPEAATEPAPAPSPEPAPADVPESVTAELPEAVPEPAPPPLVVPEPAPVAASVALPLQGVPTCTCNCTFSCK